MGYGFGGFLLVVGLVLALAVTDSINEVDLTAVGWIMAAVGVALIALTAFTMNSRRETRSRRDERRQRGPTDHDRAPHRDVIWHRGGRASGDIQRQLVTQSVASSAPAAVCAVPPLSSASCSANLQGSLMKHTLPARLTLGVASLALVVSACGGGDGRPSQDDIKDSLKDGSSVIGDESGLDALPDEALDCIAEALEESDLSDEALNAFVDGDEDYEPSGDDEDVSEDLPAAFADCAADIVGE